MAQHSDSLSETLDLSLSLHDHRIVEKDLNSSSSAPSSSSDPCLSRNLSLSRLNAQAPEFVPRCSSSQSSSSSTAQPPRIVIPQPPPPGLVHVYSAAPNSPFHVPIQTHNLPMPVQNHHHPHPHHVPVQYHHQQHYHRQYFGGAGHADHQEVAVQVQKQAPAESDHGAAHRNGLTEEATQKILNQVEYYFSDVNLATTDHLMRFINKDPEGFVPISVVASFKKIKALISSNSQLSTILRSSSKLVVSEDGKKIKRQHPLTESDMEELQSRIVVAENLPEDHCHQNLMKIFSAVGSVKTIRTCPPQVSNSGASAMSRSAKAEGMLFSNKLHAFVEYETVELAEKAVAELNDEGNWRSGLRVRLLLRRTVKSAQMRTKKLGHEGEVNSEEDGTSISEAQQTDEKNSEDHSQQFDAQLHDHAGEDHPMDKDGGQKKGRNRGRGKGRGRAHYNHNNRGSHVGTPPPSTSLGAEQPIVAKPPPGPRMPDGTRGFSMGRGKPLAVNVV